jgi:putative ABC transport system permease protein
MTMERDRLRYRALLRAWPRVQRDRYGAEMEEAFMALLRMDRERSGAFGAARCWLGAGVDAVLRGLGSRVTGTMTGGDRMGSITSDVRFALRALGRRPVFTLTAALTIAIGIGANASIFTVVNGFMVKPLPYEDEAQLIALFEGNPSLGWSGFDVNPPNAWDWRERASTLEDLTLFNQDSHNLTGGDAPELVSVIRVTPNFLSLLGHEPTLGRDFLPEELGAGRDRVAIITDGFWERRFGRDRSVLGSTLQLDGEPVTVIGILPPTFRFHDGPTDLYRPWGYDFTTLARDEHMANAIGRMRQGTSLEAARADLQAVHRELEAEYPETEGWTVEAMPLRADVVGEVASKAAVILMVAVGFILLMACVNVANLLMARAGGRAREIAVRVALGAGRRRIVRQLLTESIVLAGIGGILGTVGAVWGSRAVVSALPPTLPPVFDFGMDRTVLGFTVVITVGAAVLFGLVPALSATSDQGAVLRDGGRSGRSSSARRLGGALVVAQTAMAVVLLVSGTLLMKSVAGMRSQDLGFTPENVFTARLDPPAGEYAAAPEVTEYWEAVTSRVRDVPGVVDAGTTQSHPLMGSNWSRSIRIASQGMAEDQTRTVRLTIASTGLFEALRFGMVRGRTFTDADAMNTHSVAIVNEAFVERYLGPDDDPLAQTILGDDGWTASVVGVVHDVVERGIEDLPEPSLYLPMLQNPTRGRSLVVRTVGDPDEVLDAVQGAVWSVDADIPLAGVQTMTALIDDRVGGFAVIGYLMATFALLSLLLGAVGIYGVTAFSAGQRTAEIGVRIALGARRDDVVAMVVGDGVRRAALGLVLGIGLALAAGSAMSSILIGVSPRDPLTFIGVTTVLAAVSWAGLWIPARRASRVDPVEALAAE